MVASLDTVSRMAAAERRPPAVLAMLTALRDASAVLAATPEAAALGIRTA